MVIAHRRFLCYNSRDFGQLTMPPKKTPRSLVSRPPADDVPANAKVCQDCGHINSFRRVKCEQCQGLLPEGNFERSKRFREQSLRQQQQIALGSSLFKDSVVAIDDTSPSDDTAAKPAAQDDKAVTDAAASSGEDAASPSTSDE